MIRFNRLLIIPALLLGGCQSMTSDSASLRTITVLYTNDEHGWMEGMTPEQNAAGLYRLWEAQEDYQPDGNFLILSGGDNFTGPAISTWVEGESMVEVMNAMHYDASAVGNHEFDFGLPALSQRSREADYPYLSANTRWRETNSVATQLGILPATLLEVNDLRIGIVGLTTMDTPRTTNPLHVTDLAFIDYETALREAVADLQQQDPDMVFVISHVCLAELGPLMARVQDLNIALAGAGHCNELVARKVGRTVVLGGGFHFTAYARATITYDLNAETITNTDYRTRANDGSEENPDVAAVVVKWSDSAADSLKEVVATTTRTITRGEGLDQMIIDAWLVSYPDADIAITNMGGIRADLPAGEVTLSDLVNVLPFDNTIVSVDVEGKVVLDALNNGGRPVVAGLQRRGQQWRLSTTSEPIQPQQQYRVLLNSFMFAGGDNYGMFAEADPQGVDTGVHYRQPLLDWLKTANPRLP